MGKMIFSKNFVVSLYMQRLIFCFHEMQNLCFILEISVCVGKLYIFQTSCHHSK